MELSDSPTTGVQEDVLQTELRAGALHLPEVLMQAITHIAPGAGLILSMQFIVSQSGIVAPLAFSMAFLIVLTLGISLTQLARYLPSAGGYYTYLSRTVHPRAGFLTSWLYFLYDPMGAAINIAFFGFLLQQTAQASWGITIPWWATFLVITAFVSFMMFRGIKLAGRTLLIMGSVEILILVALGLSGLFSPGKGGLTITPFFPNHALSSTGLFLGVVFAIFSFTGFESVAPLAEESQHPRRNLPRAIILSIIIMGVFYILTAWGTVVGWGTNNVTSLINSSQNPVFVLGQRLWGGAWLLILFSLLNSIVAVSIACNNASTRVFFGMARSGSLPKVLATVHPRYKTPVGAAVLQTLITIIVGLGLGFWIGADQEFYVMGVVVTLGLGLVYIAGNIGVFQLYRTEHRAEFNWFLHAIFPLFSTVAIIFVGYESIVPLPAVPVRFAPFIVLGWLVIGVFLMIWLSRPGHTDWVSRARETLIESEG